MSSSAITPTSWGCIKETQRALVDGDWEFTEVWHIARRNGRTQDFCPIRCSKDEGIALPGYTETRMPTCPDCMVIAGVDSGSSSPTVRVQRLDGVDEHCGDDTEGDAPQLVALDEEQGHRPEDDDHGDASQCRPGQISCHEPDGNDTPTAGRLR